MLYHSSSAFQAFKKKIDPRFIELLSQCYVNREGGLPVCKTLLDESIVSYKGLFSFTCTRARNNELANGSVSAYFGSWNFGAWS